MRFFWDLYAFVYDAVAALSPYRELIHSIARQVTPGTKVLDAGCGTGNVSALLDGCEIVGLDSSVSMLARARKKVPSAEMSEADLNQRLPLVDCQFEAVVCCNVVYAVDNPQSTINELKRVLAPGGKLVIATPKCKPSIAKIVGEHIAKRGWLSLVPVLLPMLVVAVFNLIILKRGGDKKYHFLSEQEIRQLVGVDAEIRPAYAGQDWLVVWRKEGIHGHDSHAEESD